VTNLEHVRQQKDQLFRGRRTSPLTPDQRRDFSGLRYFPENPELRLEVEVEPLADADEIEMETTTGGVQRYRRYGRFRFDVDGQQATLTIYAGPHGFFLPFVDALAGYETYPAGRYLEPEQLDANRFLVDFNLAYNPYCAYNEAWSCPITPFENRVGVPVRAGEMIFEHHP
jgi:uncharacterized protein